MQYPLESSCFRILNPQGETVGTGFLVAKNLVITCAHVVLVADSVNRNTIPIQSTRRNEIFNAQILTEYWHDIDKGDIAFLALAHTPTDSKPLPLGLAEHSHPGNAFRSFGYASAADVNGIFATGTVDGYMRDQWLLQLQSPQANHGISGAPVLDVKRGVVIGMITKGHRELGRNQYTTFATPSELLFEICPEIRPSETCPYLGLEAFTEETSRFFFGRAVLTEKLFEVLRGGNRFLALFGPSGSGKSSVVQAGLLPALKQGQLPDSEKWAQVVMRPADNPFEQMKAAGFDPIDVNAYFDSHRGVERLVVFIDQFEELFILCSDELRNRFVDDLTNALEDDRLILIMCMRDDFYSAFTAKAGLLAESKHLRIENVPRILKQDESIAMIERPADAVGLVLEEGLTELIIKDLTRGTEMRSSNLPLLEFALIQLWEKRRDGRLTHEAYRNIGGVTGSLARWADDAYSDLPRPDQPLAESLLTSLVHLGDEAQGLPTTRRRRTLNEFDNVSQHIIKHFTDQHLVITSGNTVELIHDALLREWGMLHDWLESDRDNLRLQDGVMEAARQWEVSGRDKSLINHRDARLELALAMSKNPRYWWNPVEQAYLDACVELREKQKNARETLWKRILMGLLFGLVIALVLTGFAIYQMKQAQVQTRIAIARQINVEAQTLYASGNSKQMTAVLLAIQSMRMLPSGEAAIIKILQNNILIAPIVRMAHNGRVNSVAFSPDGKFVASASFDKTVRIWDVTTGKEIDRMIHDDSVNTVVFSPDGKYIVSASNDKTARVWDAVTGKEVARMTHDGTVNIAIFSPDGLSVVSGSCDQGRFRNECTKGSVRVWEVTTGKEIARMSLDSYVNSLAFSPDGKYIVSGDDSTIAHVWDAISGKEISRMEHVGGVTAVAFSPDSQYVVSGSWSNTIQVWKATTGEVLTRLTFNNDTNFVTSVAFSPDGQYVVAGSDDNTARVWDAFTGKEIARMTHDSSVDVVACSPDGKYVVSGSSDKTARVWEATTGKEVARITHEGFVTSVAFTPDGKYVVSGSSDKTVQIWDTTTRQEITRIVHDNSSIFSIAFSPDSQYIVSGSSDNTARVWKVATGKEIARMTHNGVVYSVAFSPNGKYVVSGSSDKTARVLEAMTGKEIARMTQDDAVDFVAFSPDGKYVVSGSSDKVFRIWEASTGKEVSHMKHDDGVTSIAFTPSAAFSPDGKFVITAGCDQRNSHLNCTEGSVRIWTVATGKEIARMMHNDAVDSLAFSPDGKYVVSGSWDKTARIWDVNTGKEIARMTHEGIVNSVAFSPDGKYVVSGSNFDSARVWEANTGKEIFHTTYDGGTSFVAFSPDGQYVVSVNWKTVYVWDTTTGKEIANMIHDGRVTAVALSPDGKYVVSAGDDGIARIWYYRPEDLIDEACSRVTRNLTHAEWQQYVGDTVPYQTVCPNLPIETEPIPTP